MAHTQSNSPVLGKQVNFYDFIQDIHWLYHCPSSSCPPRVLQMFLVREKLVSTTPVKFMLEVGGILVASMNAPHLLSNDSLRNV